MKPLKLTLLMCALLFSNTLLAQVSKDAAVLIEVSVTNNPPNINLHWPLDANATGYTVYRRLPGNVWGSGTKKLAANSTGYLDTTVSVGQKYEYQVQKTLKVGTTALTAVGYTESGIEIPAVNTRGKLILLVDNTFSDSLKTELLRLSDDLRNDGWQVIRHDVSRSAKVTDIKDIISADWNADPVHTTALFLFGHIPVPYSGFLNPDGHPEHHGAWPADVYYGEFDYGDWPDDQSLYHDSLAISLTAPNKYDTVLVGYRNRNKAGDGKFDFTQIPGPIYLMIGRVDLFNMPSFPKKEKDLLKQYLDKDHAFRTGTLTAPVRALLEDSFGYFGGEAFASSGWRNLAPLVGASNIKEITGINDSARTYQWLPEIDTNAYLWAYGCGGGWPQGAGGAGETNQWSRQHDKLIFTMLFGSWFGDWDTVDNFLRAPLATDYGLSCAWSGRPYWNFFPMGLGEPIGYCAQLTQNNTGDYSYNYAANWVHIALMGDPTLLLHPYVPPTALTVTANASHNNAILSWQPSSDKSILGYNVYRSNHTNSADSLISPSPVVGTSFTDMHPLTDTNAYSVRAVKLETTPSGSYYNLSAGARSWIAGLVKNAVAEDRSANDLLEIHNIAAGIEIILHTAEASNVKIEIYDVSGKLVSVLDDRGLVAGSYNYVWQTDNVATGVYVVRSLGMKEPLTAKIVVIH
jgi:hypothetical protein